MFEVRYLLHPEGLLQVTQDCLPASRSLLAMPLQRLRTSKALPAGLVWADIHEALVFAPVVVTESYDAACDKFRCAIWHVASL